MYHILRTNPFENTISFQQLVKIQGGDLWWKKFKKIFPELDHNTNGATYYASLFPRRKWAVISKTGCLSCLYTRYNFMHSCWFVHLQKIQKSTIKKRGSDISFILHYIGVEIPKQTYASETFRE